MRRLAALTAAAAWASLFLQLWLVIANNGLAQGIWLFVGYFTILTNILVAVMATGLSIGGEGKLLTGASARMAVTAAILMVGIAYWLLLAAHWQPQGLQLLADIGLHTAVPLLALAMWVAARDSALEWRKALLAAVWPATYALYAIVRGQVDGWYAYWFLNPNQQSLGQMALSIAGLSALVVGIAMALIAIDRLKRHLLY